MHTPGTGGAGLPGALKRLALADKLGAAAVAVGVVWLALGIYAQDLNAGLSMTLRAMGGAAFLGGLVTLALWEPRRRAAVLGAARRAVRRYLARTAGWRWPDRWGLAAMLVGLGLATPAIFLQAAFGGGTLLAAPAIAAFWGGMALLVYGRFYRRNRDRALSRRDPSSRRGRRWQG